MISRQEAVLSFVKFNKFFKQLNYDIGVTGKVHLSQYADELMEFEQWVDNVIEYVLFNPDPKIIDLISALGSSEIIKNYAEEGKAVLEASTYDALSKVIDSTAKMLSLVNESIETSKGKFTSLPEAFAFQDAENLFLRAVKAGYLTSDFQPKGDTDLYTLKILGFAIGEELKLAPRHKWSHFEELWNIDYANKLSSVPISAKQFQRAKTLMDLYPEVDFNLLIKPKEDSFFTAAYGNRKIRTLYKELVAYGYISKETDYDNFLSIFNLGNSKFVRPVEWISDQRHLAYFIHHTFTKTNKNCWVKAHACFTINGAPPNLGTMKSGIVSLQRKPTYETYDLVLKRIASEYNNE